MLLTGISLIGWLHLIACLVAIPTGAIALAWRKGSPLHRRMGRWYVLTMLVASLTALCLYRFDFLPGHRPAAGVFGVFHWETVATLLLLGLGYYSASRQRRAFWAYAHPIAMISTYSLLIGGLINEMFARITPLRALVILHGQFNFASPILGLTQSMASLLFLLAMIWFVGKVLLQRRRLCRRRMPSAAAIS
jgi:uncharacterized membrane protein